MWDSCFAQPSDYRRHPSFTRPATMLPAACCRSTLIQPGVFRGRDELRASRRARVMPLVPGEAGVEVGAPPLQLRPRALVALLLLLLRLVTASCPLSLTPFLTPCMQVLSQLPPMGTALPVVVPQPRNQPPFQLPPLGAWVKLKVVGVQLHEVRSSGGAVALKGEGPACSATFHHTVTAVAG